MERKGKTRTAINGKYAFPSSLRKQMIGNIPTYAIGVYTTKDANCYTLVKKVKGEIEILLCKTIENKDEFNKEVENLTKYFNATNIREEN